MTAFELNAAVYQGLQAISGNENYMQQVLDLIKKLTKQSKTTNNNIHKIHIDLSRPSSLDEFVGMVSSNREDDKKAKEQYFKEKYEKYL
jgi:hypothetical protein